MMRFSILLAACALLMLTGCATIEPAYQYSHQVMLEKTVETMNVQQALRVKVPKGSSVAVVSMEAMKTTDHPVIALVEDGLMELILRAGYTPLERDANLLERLFHEQADGKYVIPVMPDTLVVEEPYELPVLDTDLSAAEYLVSYRVLEAGLRYRKADSMGKTKREALVRLNVRIERAPYGDILWAGEMNGEFTDEIDNELVVPLSDYHYTFFGHRLPLQKKAPKPRAWWPATPKAPTAGTSVESSSGVVRNFGVGFASPSGDFGDVVESGLGLSYHWQKPTSNELFLGVSTFFSYHSLADAGNTDGSWTMLEILGAVRYQMPSGGYGFFGLGMNHSRFEVEYNYYDPEWGFEDSSSFEDDETNLAWAIGGGYMLNEQWDFQALLHSIQDGDSDLSRRYLTLTAGINF